MVLCGAQPVMYTYPAWSFGGRHGGADTGLAGPGPGGVAARTTMGTQGPVFGPCSRGPQRAAEPHGEYNMPVSQGPRPPAFTMGGRRRDITDKTPGPAHYDAARHTMRSAPTSSWGAPPRALRPASTPRPLREEAPVRKTKGPSFGLPYSDLRQEPTPGPQDYCLCSGSCCRACSSYNGVTMKGRQPQMYGKVTTLTPGPANYHTDCSTIGVATAYCTSGPRRQTNGPTYFTTAPHMKGKTLPPQAMRSSSRRA